MVREPKRSTAIMPPAINALPPKLTALIWLGSSTIPVNPLSLTNCLPLSVKLVELVDQLGN